MSGCEDYLLDLLTAAGLSFRIDGERLIVSPPELITEEIEREIKAHKPELMEAVRLAEYRAHWSAIEPHYAAWSAWTAARRGG